MDCENPCPILGLALKELHPALQHPAGVQVRQQRAEHSRLKLRRDVDEILLPLAALD
jgi:hypothetical protein